MSENVENALKTANYDKLLQSGLQVSAWQLSNCGCLALLKLSLTSRLHA
jgi:tRNA modification GTPase